MAITLTSTPASTREGETINVFAGNNPLFFEFTADAGETSLQVQVQTTAGAELGTLPTLPFWTGGTLDVDVAYILRNSLSNNDNTDNSRGVITTTGTGSAIAFKLAYRVGGTGSYTVLSTTYNAVNAVRQMGSTYGATLAEYVPLFTGTTIDFTGKFLTLFENPVLFWWSDIANPTDTQASFWSVQTAFATRTADIGKIDAIGQDNYNGATLEDSTLSTITTTTTVTTAKINLIQEKIEYTSTVISAGINSLGTLDTAIAPLTFEIRRACQNPKAIKWFNTLGTWETWVFEGRSATTLETESSGEYGIYNKNIATATETRRNFSKTARKVMSLQADNLLLDQVLALEEIFYSPNVLLYTGPLTNGIAFEDWQGVTVSGGSSTSADTYNKRHKISFDINLVDIQTISN
jgi:hypothetical protein